MSPKPNHPSPYKPNRASCEICWADSSETTIYCFKQSSYCEQHYYEVKYKALEKLCAKQQ
jgi:hypothetical protein